MGGVSFCPSPHVVCLCPDEPCAVSHPPCHPSLQYIVTTALSQARSWLTPARFTCLPLPYLPSSLHLRSYLFSDMLLLAAHELVSSRLGRTSEALKKSLTSGGGAVRPTTVNEAGQETMHKFKFQRLVMMDEVTVLDCTEDVENGFIIRFPRGSVYYESPSLEEKRFFLKTFTQVASAYRDDMRASGPVLHARRSLRAQQEKEAARASAAMSSAFDESATERETEREGEGQGTSPGGDASRTSSREPQSREHTPTPTDGKEGYISVGSSVAGSVAGSERNSTISMDVAISQPIAMTSSVSDDLPEENECEGAGEGQDVTGEIKADAAITEQPRSGPAADNDLVE